MRPVFDRITQLSIRYKWITLGLTAVMMALGAYSALTLNVELLPSIELPSTYILARSNGSTSGDLMLQAYTMTIEDQAGDVDGVVNRESNTSNGFAFLEIRNEFGLDQENIQADLQAILNTLPLPVRTLMPPEGMTVQNLIGDLPSEVVIYLYAYSQQENISFLVALDPDVWRSFSPAVLGALPETVFADLDQSLAGELLTLREGEVLPLPEDLTVPPALPPTWQTAGFSTAQDLTELVGVRSLAGLFNDFLEDGYITGPLGTTTDLTPEMLRIVLDLETRCQTYVTANTHEGTPDLTSCSLLSKLDGEALAALLTQYQAGIDGKLADDLVLPTDYLLQLNQEDRNTIAAALIAQFLTGSRSVREVVLPDEWRLEEPRLITFSFSDIPLGMLSVSTDMSRDDLQHLVDNEIVPRLAALELVADVSVQGGEKIRPDLLNEALATEGLPEENTEVVSDNPTETSATATTGSPDASAVNPVAIAEGPALPTSWALFATQLPGVDELDTADDLLRIPGITPSQLFNQALSMAADNPAAAPFINRAFTDLTPEILDFLNTYEAGFYDSLSKEVLKAFSSETLRALPTTAQDRAAAPDVPALGQFWQQVAAQPEMAALPVLTADDLAALADDPAQALNHLVLDTPPDIQFYAVQLVNDLSPAVISYLVEHYDDFIVTLDPQVICDFSQEGLTLPAIQDRWADQDWLCQRADGSEVALEDIASGKEKTAAQSLLGDSTATRIYDPDAPALPADWPGVAGFVGAQELDTADDLFYTVDSSEVRTPSQLLNVFTRPDGQRYVIELPAEVLLYVADCQDGKLCEADFYENLSDKLLTLLSDETASQLPESVQARRDAALLGLYVPEQIVTRTNSDNSLILDIRKEKDANTVLAWDQVKEVLHELEQEHPEIEFAVAFEQASYIEESISGVAREGGLGAVMAVIVILIFLNFSVRSTLVTAVSIPTSVALAFVMMKWLPGNVYSVLFPLSENATGAVKDILTFLLRLFPQDISLNIMTLSGLTVAIGRVVDDAIVVLENIYRNVQKGEDRLQAILHGTRDVSVAIFAATVTTVVVFLPIGLFGGIIGAFFLPFGLAVTYALMASFVVAITVVPLLAFLFIKKDLAEEHQDTRMERGYRQVIQWSLKHRWGVMGIATAAFVAGLFILSQLPTAFLPSFGEPTISVSVSLPDEIDGKPTTIAVLDAKVRRLENYLNTLEGIGAVQTSVGGAGNEIVESENITETEAVITIAVENEEMLDSLTPLVRHQAELIFNDLNRDGVVEAEQDNVTVSGASLSEQGFGGFAVVVSGDVDNPPTLAELQQYDTLIVTTLESIEGVTNVKSSLANVGSEPSKTYIRIDGIPAVRYTAELETKDTLGLTREAIDAVTALDLPENVTVGEGFESQQQTEGFQQTFISMGIAVVIVYFVMVLTFGSLIHPVTILFSLPLAIVGAAIGLGLTGRVLGLSSVVGLLMLVGIVVTNAIVLIDRVQTNRKVYKMGTNEALINGGATRLRPILMTAIATMVALLPLAIGLSEGAIIASELGTVVIGGLFSSTLLTLIVVPVVFSLFDSVQTAVAKQVNNKQR